MSYVSCFHIIGFQSFSDTNISFKLNGVLKVLLYDGDQTSQVNFLSEVSVKFSNHQLS
ncbi:MAG: hypothetical protein LBC61_01410 [Candidatus Peribacteria bacterium]|nr:hypothetical protein [Candidatus Peribacteria bacterium]